MDSFLNLDPFQFLINLLLGLIFLTIGLYILNKVWIKNIYFKVPIDNFKIYINP